MPILLDHLIVPSRNPIPAAQSLADILDVRWERGQGPFTPVYVSGTLTLDFAQSEGFDKHHYCFCVGNEEFTGILARVSAAGFKHRSTPRGPDDLQLRTHLGGRNFYWTDRDGHVWEVLTVSYARQKTDAPTRSA